MDNADSVNEELQAAGRDFLDMVDERDGMSAAEWEAFLHSSADRDDLDAVAQVQERARQALVHRVQEGLSDKELEVVLRALLGLRHHTPPEPTSAPDEGPF